MDQGEEQLDYEDEEYAAHNPHLQTGAAISALADEEMAEDDEYDDLYHDVNVGFIGAAEQPVKQQHDLGNGRGLPPRPYAAAAKDEAEDRTRADQLPAQAKNKFEGAPGAAEAATKDGGEEDGGQGFARSTTGKGPAEAAQRGGESTSGPASARAGTPTSAASTPNRSGPNRDSFGTDHAGRHGSGGFAGESGGSMLFVGDLQWWTTDAELEAALSEYGKVKYMKFFEEKASGKSKGYCQVQFFEHSAARACKEGMNGRVFNGRPCVVAFANPRTVKQMGDAMANKGQSAHPQEPQPRRMMNDGGGRPGGSFQSGEGARHYGARMGGGSARGPHGQNRGGQGGQGRGRGGMAGKNMGRGAGGSSGGGGAPYGQGLLGPMGGPPGAMMHPQGMMGSQGFDPGFGPQMGRGGAGGGGAAGAGGGYGGFAPHAPPFPGMVPSFPAIGSVALPGVAPHVNPAFFGRGMAAANGMGMLPGAGGLEGHHAGMWNDSGGWGGGGGGGGGGGDGQNRRLGDMGYGEDAGSEYGYGEKGYDRGGGRSNVARDRDRGAESDWAGHSEKRHRSEREADWERERDRDRERDRYREKERDGYRDQRERDRHWDGEGDWGKDRAPRSRSKSRTVEDDGDQWPAAKESDYGKRRR